MGRNIGTMKTRDEKLIELVVRAYYDSYDDDDLMGAIIAFMEGKEYLQFCKDNPEQNIQSSEMLDTLLNNAIRHLNEEQKAQLVISLFERCENREEIREKIGDGWISVEDRLPEPIDTSVEAVIVILNQGRSRDVISCLYSKDLRFYFAHGDMLKKSFILNNVTHWMPLPNPPKP